MLSDIKWGPSGEAVYTRTYARTLPDGTKEVWPDTVRRVARGNLELVYGDWDKWKPEVWDEFNTLVDFMESFKIIPAGRHLWASGVPGRQYLFNCHVSGWGEKFSDHFAFTFLRLMEGGGVGANYSSRFLKPYALPQRDLTVHVVCDPTHADYEALKAAGALSEAYSPEWAGAFLVEDSREGWAAALTDLLDTYWRSDVEHQNRVYDVTNVRPAGSRLRTFGGAASGPLPLAVMLAEVAEVLNGALAEFWSIDPFSNRTHITPLEAMEIDHAIAKCVVSGGNRRSARMAMVEWDDPYIFDFIKCKSDSGKHWTTNISVAVDDRFFSELNTAQASGTECRDMRAWMVHEAVVDGMLTNGEPGYWNRTLSNEGEPNEVVCTNPCGEIALMEWENCNLGHVNMDAFVLPSGGVDTAGLSDAHVLMTRFLIRATYGDVNDPRQRERLAANRRIGVGHFGVQGFLVKMGVKYSEAPDSWFPRLLDGLYEVVRRAAREYAFELRIPEPVKVTTVAPTGSIAKLPGRTEGIHPIYARYFIRRMRFSTVDPEQVSQVSRYAAEGFNVINDPDAPDTVIVEFPTMESLVQEVIDRSLDPSTVESADEISLAAMLNFQAMYQKHYADNAVSFTVNVPEGKCSPEDVAAQLALFLPYLKGTTLMPDGTRALAPYERITEEQYRQAGRVNVADSVDEECASGACPIR